MSFLIQTEWIIWVHSCHKTTTYWSATLWTLGCCPSAFIWNGLSFSGWERSQSELKPKQKHLCNEAVRTFTEPTTAAAPQPVAALAFKAALLICHSDKWASQTSNQRGQCRSRTCGSVEEKGDLCLICDEQRNWQMPVLGQCIKSLNIQ